MRTLTIVQAEKGESKSSRGQPSPFDPAGAGPDGSLRRTADWAPHVTGWPDRQDGPRKEGM